MKEKKQTGKKQKASQKIALERIYRLFELAQKEKEYAKRYTSLAAKIGRKTNTKIPLELKHKYCRKCYSVDVKASEKKPFLIVKCDECGEERKYSLNSRK